jgi:hypothetical protein
MTARARLSFDTFARGLRWIDRRRLLSLIEPYRMQLFKQFFDERDDAGRPRFNLGVLICRGEAPTVRADLTGSKSVSPAGASGDRR